MLAKIFPFVRQDMMSHAKTYKAITNWFFLSFFLFFFSELLSESTTGLLMTE